MVTLYLLASFLIFKSFIFEFLFLIPNDKILRFFLIANFLCSQKKLSSAFKIIKPLSFVLLIISDFANAICFKFLKFLAWA